MKILLLVTSFSFFLLFSFAAKAQGLDVNDVSFLLPLNQQGPYPSYSLQQLPGLTEENFLRVLTFENPGVSPDHLPYTDAHFMKARQNWRLISWRFDPCGEEFHFTDSPDIEALIADEGTACRPRLRLVFQPMSVYEQPLASAIHLLYSLNDATALNLANNLIELRDLSAQLNAPTLRVPLSVHPALVKELATKDLQFSMKMLSVIQETASKGELEFVTFAVRATVNHWRFVGGTIHKGVWTRFVSRFSFDFYDWSSSTLKLGVEDISCDQLSICSTLPAPKSSPQETISTLNEIFGIQGREQQIPGRRSIEVRRKAEVVEDTSRTNFFGTNCISCHESSNLRDRGALLEQNSTDLAGPTPFVSKRFVTDRTSSVINFGYFGTIARISTRTAAESVTAALRTNQLLGLTFIARPLPQLETFWNCLMSQSNYQNCMTQ